MEARANRSWLLNWAIALAVVALLWLAPVRAVAQVSHPEGDANYPFTTVSTYPTDLQPVGAADFQGDGAADLVMRNNQLIWVALGNGDGTLGPLTEVGATTGTVLIGDFDDDGVPDLLTARHPAGSSSGSEVAILHGEGDGTFTDGSSRPGVPTVDLTAGDFDGDGDLDLAAPSRYLRLYPIEDGQIGAPQEQDLFPTEATGAADNTRYIADGVAADANHDGLTDLYLETRRYGNPGGGSGIITVAADPDGGFAAPVPVTGAPARYDNWTAADVDVDGETDVVANGWQLSDSNIGVEVAFGGGLGNPFTLSGQLRSRPNDGSYDPAIADFNQDGWLDITSQGYWGHVDYWQNIDGRTFDAAIVGEYPHSGPMRLVSADFNGDGYPDLAARMGTNLAIQINELAPPPPPDPDPDPLPDPDPDVPPVVSGGKLDLRVGDMPRRLSAKRLARGLEVGGSSSPASQVHAELTVSAAVARRLGLDSTLLVSGDAIWDGDGSLTLRTGGAGRAALKAYRGRRFEVTVEVAGKYLDADTGDPVRAEPQTRTVRVSASRRQG